MSKPLVGLVLGSKSDESVGQKCLQVLQDFGIPCEFKILSAHRTPLLAAHYAQSAEKRGLRVIIAGAGLSAALPGVLAAHTLLPVIGLPIPAGSLGGLDALLSIVQMPPGIPVACVGIDNAKNAAILAAHILALQDAALRRKLERFRKDFGDQR